MSKEQFSDQQIVLAIQQGGEEREAVLKYLFRHERYRQQTESVVEKGGGDEKYAKLVYENCLIELDKIVRRKQYSDSSLESYFDKTSRILWCSELTSSESARGLVLNHLAKDKDLRRKIQFSVLNNSGSEEDAQDIYQNGLMLIDDHMKNGKFRGGTVKGFFYQACFNLWRNELKRKKCISLPDDGTELTVTNIDPQEVMERKERAELLKKVFNELNKRCQEVLRLRFFVIDKYSMADIARIMGLKNAQNAANALSKCRTQLRNLLMQHESAYQWIQNV